MAKVRKIGNDEARRPIWLRGSRNPTPAHQAKERAMSEGAKLMSRERLAEIEARVKAATEGPWYYEPSDQGDRSVGLDGYGPSVTADEDGENPIAERWNSDRDANFSAHARTDIPDLLSHIAALERREKLLVAEVEAWRAWKPCGKCGNGLIPITIDHDDGLPPQHSFDMCPCFVAVNAAEAATDAAGAMEGKALTKDA